MEFQPTRYRLAPSQALAIGFGIAISVGTALLSLPAATVGYGRMDLISALFEATSAVCVTGLVVVDTGTQLTPFGQGVILALIQIGGLGITTMSSLAALILGRRITLRGRLLIQETLNQVTLQGVVRLTRYVFAFTLAVEGLGALLLSLYWAPSLGMTRAVYFGVFHSVSAFNNAGFDLFGQLKSLSDFAADPFVNVIIGGLFVLGGLGFMVIAEVQNDFRPRKWSLHTRVVLATTLILSLATSGAVMALEYGNPETMGPFDLSGKILAAVFQGVAPRTAGFSTLDIGGMHQSTLVILALMMFIGASPGGTGGGVKTTTVAASWALVWATVKGDGSPHLFGRRLAWDTVRKALSLIGLAVAFLTLVIILLSVTEGERFAFLELMFEAVSALGTVGLSTGITPEISPLGRLLLTVTMFAGRVGPFTLVSALAIRHRQDVRYAEEHIVVG